MSVTGTVLRNSPTQINSLFHTPVTTSESNVDRGSPLKNVSIQINGEPITETNTNKSPGEILIEQLKSQKLLISKELEGGHLSNFITQQLTQPVLEQAVHQQISVLNAREELLEVPHYPSNFAINFTQGKDGGLIMHQTAEYCEYDINLKQGRKTQTSHPTEKPFVRVDCQIRLPALPEQGKPSCKVAIEFNGSGSNLARVFDKPSLLRRIGDCIVNLFNTYFGTKDKQVEEIRRTAPDLQRRLQEEMEEPGQATLEGVWHPHAHSDNLETEGLRAPEVEGSDDEPKFEWDDESSATGGVQLPKVNPKFDLEEALPKVAGPLSPSAEEMIETTIPSPVQPLNQKDFVLNIEGLNDYLDGTQLDTEALLRQLKINMQRNRSPV